MPTSDRRERTDMMRCVLDDTSLIGAYAKALGYPVMTREERARFNVSQGLRPNGAAMDSEDAG